jgi:predicted metalloprotease with PDZ domain
VMRRADVTSVKDFAADMGRALDTVLNSPGRQVRTAEEMSQMAPFVDAATAIDRTSFDNTFISYYTWGSAIALGLDLSLRVQTNHRVTLDELMRALWQRHGKPGGRLTGYVDNPYTIDDVRMALSAVSGNQAFADDFFRRYIQGHEVVDYESLLARAGLVFRKAAAGRPWIGELRLQDTPNGVRVSAASPFGSPAYAAGVDRDDVILSLGGVAVSDVGGLLAAVATHKPGDRVAVTFDRRGERHTSTINVTEDPRRELLTVEDAGMPLTDAQRRFRTSWLSSQTRNTF